MQEKPKVSVTRTRRDSAAKEFSFTAESVPAGSLKDVRAKAWDAFKKLSMPITTDEAWRRTDLRLLPASDFKIPKEGAFEDLPVVPENLLKRYGKPEEVAYAVWFLASRFADYVTGQIINIDGGFKME